MEKSNTRQQPLSPGQYEYLLVANPDETVFNKVMDEKQLFDDRYKEKVAVKTKPHITVANFRAVESMEDTVIRWIERICNKQHSFRVELNNFSGFPPDTIYVRVQNPQPFQQLAKQLQVISDYIEDDDCPLHGLKDKPHLTIARRLPADVYVKAMIDYSQRDFHSSFMVTELVLLKRQHQSVSCEKVMVFRFLPAEVDLFAATG
ncbi:MAG: 2'-5' RNA ligase family protein [Chitinophagaceae bacterium]